MWQGQDDTMQGAGCPGGCQGADGPRYQWVQGVDGLGNTVGYWQPTRPMMPGAPYARNAAPFFGEVAEAADGQLYQWVQGIDGLGSPFGFWKKLKRLAKKAMPLARRLAPFVPGGAAALTMATPFLKQAGIAGLGEIGALYAAPDGSLYQVQGVDAADSIEGFADDDLRGFADDELRGLSDDELRGLAADDELQGFGSSDDLDGFADADELNGIGAEPDLDGFAASDPLDGMEADELNGFAASDDLEGIGDDELRGVGDEDRTMNGYVRDGRMNGIEGYQREAPPRTPSFSPAPNAPMWAPLW
jgi:hypothetical protein